MFTFIMLMLGGISLSACFCTGSSVVNLIGSIVFGAVLTYFFEVFLDWRRNHTTITYKSKSKLLIIKANRALDCAEINISDLKGNALKCFQQEIAQRKHNETTSTMLAPSCQCIQEGRDFHKLIHYKVNPRKFFKFYSYVYVIDLVKDFPDTYTQLPEKFLIEIVDRNSAIPLIASKQFSYRIEED